MASVILVTNDDGIHAQGLSALAQALESLGEVFVVAPDREQSAVGHALTLHRPLRVDQVGERRYAVNGTPSDCVNLGVLGLLPERPCSWRRASTTARTSGDDVTYSGTVSAAMEGTLLGVPSMAVSQSEGDGGGVRGRGRGWRDGRGAAPRRRAAGEDAAERERAARRRERHSDDAARASRVQREGDRRRSTRAGGRTTGSARARRSGRRTRPPTSPPSTRAARR